MPVRKIPFPLLIIFLLLSGELFAQNATVSPYSRYGLGDIAMEGFAKNNGMGGIGIAFRPQLNINSINPASYSAISLTTFEFGASAVFTQLTTTTSQQNKSDATFSYFALGFPVMKNKWGAALGLVPYSAVGYKIYDAVTDGNAGSILYTYEGSGGLNRFFIGNSVKVVKNLSAGFNASYLFGSLERTNNIIFSDANFFNSRFTETSVIRNVFFNFGMQYAIDSLPARLKTGDTTYTIIKTDRALNFGLTFSLPTDLSAGKNMVGTRYLSSGLLTYVQDTIVNIEGEKGIITVPYSIGVGMVYKKGNKWLIGVDAAMQNWEEYSYFGEDDSLRNSLRISAGAQYIPDDRAMKTYWQSVQYRVGMFYNQTYLQLKSSKLNEFGLTMGLGLPLRKVLSMIQISAQFGRRGTTENSLIREDFSRFTLGITFNDRWFIKSKFD